MHVCEVRWLIAPDFDFDGSDKAEDWFVFGVLGQNLGASPGHLSFVGEQKGVAFVVVLAVAGPVLAKLVREQKTRMIGLAFGDEREDKHFVTPIGLGSEC